MSTFPRWFPALVDFAMVFIIKLHQPTKHYFDPILPGNSPCLPPPPNPPHRRFSPGYMTSSFILYLWAQRSGYSALSSPLLDTYTVVKRNAKVTTTNRPRKFLNLPVLRALLSLLTTNAVYTTILVYIRETFCTVLCQKTPLQGFGRC